MERCISTSATGKRDGKVPRPCRRPVHGQWRRFGEPIQRICQRRRITTGPMAPRVETRKWTPNWFGYYVGKFSQWQRSWTPEEFERRLQDHSLQERQLWPKCARNCRRLEGASVAKAHCTLRTRHRHLPRIHKLIIDTDPLPHVVHFVCPDQYVVQVDPQRL